MNIKKKFPWIILIAVVPSLDTRAFLFYKNANLSLLLMLGLQLIICIYGGIALIGYCKVGGVKKRQFTKTFIYGGTVLLFNLLGGLLGGNSWTSIGTRSLSIVCVFLFYFYFISEENYINIIKYLNKAVLLCIVIGIVLYLFNFSETLHVERAGVYRYKGIASNRNGYVTLTLFYLASSMVIYINEKKHLLLYLFASAVAFLTTIATFSSNSIITMTGFVFMVVIFYICKIPMPWKTMLILYAIILFAMMSGTADAIIKLVATLFGKSATLTGRTYLWEISLDIFSKSPLFGSGFDQTLMAQADVYGNNLNDSHNGFLYILVTQGLFGLIAWVMFFCSFFKNSKQLLKFDKTYIILCCYIFACLIRAFGESSLYYTHSLFFVSLFALERTPQKNSC